MLVIRAISKGVGKKVDKIKEVFENAKVQEKASGD